MKICREESKSIKMAFSPDQKKIRRLLGRFGSVFYRIRLLTVRRQQIGRTLFTEEKIRFAVFGCRPLNAGKRRG